MATELPSYRFSKAEKLCSKLLIEAIYDRGKKVKSFPFILNYLEVDEHTEMDFPVQITTAVPKRKVKLAVKRNRLKRQIREAYRLNKFTLIEEAGAQNKKLALFLIYIGKEKESYDFIEEKLILVLEKLRLQITQKHRDES